MKLARREVKKARIEIIPMIDTVFFLLVFFMMASLAMNTYRGMPVNLPRAESGQPTRDDNAAITLARDGQTFLNREPTTPEALGGPAQVDARRQPEPRGDDQRRRRRPAPPRGRRVRRGAHRGRRARGHRGHARGDAETAMRRGSVRLLLALGVVAVGAPGAGSRSPAIRRRRGSRWSSSTRSASPT